MLKGFRNFLMRGDVITVAVGLVVALAFSNLVKAFTDSVINPLVAAAQPGHITFGLGWQLGKAGNKATFIDIGSFLSAIIMFLMTTLSGRDLRGMAFWLMGDLSSPAAIDLRWLYFILLVVLGSIYTTSSDLNLILTGEQEARHLGVNVKRVKLVVYIGASLLTGLAVSVSGAIGYVGLLVPHVMRMMFGTDYRLLIPASALGGAIAIVIADTLARTVVAPTELPVGAMTALAGAPVFIYLMRRKVR